jgi:hypothetical protein
MRRAATAGALLLSLARVAAGQETQASESATEQARALFAEGTDKAHHGDWSAALAAYERSEALRPHAVTTYNIGYVERALGRYTRARKMLGRALAENAAHGGVELPEDLAASAKAYLSEVERQIARAVVSVSPEGASVLVDGRPLERATTGGPREVLWAGTRDVGAAEPAPAATFELQIDPGSHVLAISRGGYVDDVSTRTFEPGSEANVVVQLTPRVAEPPARPVAAQASDAQERRSTPARVPIFIALGVGAAGMVAGTVAGAMAFDLKGQGAGHYGQAGTAADVSTVTFIVGAAGVATAGLLWWLSPSGAPPAPSAQGVHVVPWMTPAGGGVAGTF